MSVSKVEERGQLFGVRAKLFVASVAIGASLLVAVPASIGGAASEGGGQSPRLDRDGAGYGAGARSFLLGGQEARAGGPGAASGSAPHERWRFVRARPLHGARRVCPARADARPRRGGLGDDAGRAARRARPSEKDPRSDAGGGGRRRPRRAHRAGEPGAPVDAPPRRPRQSASCSSRRCGTPSSSEMLEARAEASIDRPVELELPGLKPRRLLVHAAPLSGDDEGLLFVFVDVTEVRRLESLRRDFVANASHELRTPVAAVRSATETLRSGALEDPVAAIRFVDIIERNAQRLQSLVEDMLELSKLESNEFKLKRERVELGSVVPIVLALFRERAEKKGVRLVPSCRGNRARWRAIREPSSTCCRTWSTTRSSTARRDARTGERGEARRRAGQAGGERHRAPGSRPSTCRASSSASIASTPVDRASSAARASAFPS
jgi:hypothetical protein